MGLSELSAESRSSMKRELSEAWPSAARAMLGGLGYCCLLDAAPGGLLMSQSCESTSLSGLLLSGRLRGDSRPCRPSMCGREQRSGEAVSRSPESSTARCSIALEGPAGRRDSSRHVRPWYWNWSWLICPLGHARRIASRGR